MQKYGTGSDFWPVVQAAIQALHLNQGVSIFWGVVQFFHEPFLH